MSMLMEVHQAAMPASVMENVNNQMSREEYIRSYDLKKFDPLIIKIIREKRLSIAASSDMCLDNDDLMSMGREFLWHALHKYDPTRGMKEDSFIHMFLLSKFGNIKNKALRKNEAGTISFSEAMSSAIMDSSKHNGESDVISSFHHLDNTVRELSNAEQAACERIDVQMVMDQLKGFKKTLFIEYYVQGYTILEIAHRYPDIPYHKIRRELRNLQKIYNTLCKGILL